MNLVGTREISRATGIDNLSITLKPSTVRLTTHKHTHTNGFKKLLLMHGCKGNSFIQIIITPERGIIAGITRSLLGVQFISY